MKKTKKQFGVCIHCGKQTSYAIYLCDKHRDIFFAFFKLLGLFEWYKGDIKKIVKRK